MDHNNPLQNDIHNGFIDNGGFNSYSSNLPPTNVIQEQPSSNTSYNNLTTSYDFSAASYAANNYEQQPMFYNEHATSTLQSYPTNSSNSGHNVNSSPLINFPQINNPEIFRFEIPGFKIVVVPTTLTTSPCSNLTNLNMQNHLQDHTFSNIITYNSQSQFQQQQRNSLDVNESFINFNNFRG